MHALKPSDHSETSVSFYHATQRYNPEDYTLQIKESHAERKERVRLGLTISPSVLVSSPFWGLWPQFKSQIWSLQPLPSRSVLAY
jgi:hypothetical protein